MFLKVCSYCQHLDSFVFGEEKCKIKHQAKWSYIADADVFHYNPSSLRSSESWMFAIHTVMPVQPKTHPHYHITFPEPGEKSGGYIIQEEMLKLPRCRSCLFSLAIIWLVSFQAWNVYRDLTGGELFVRDDFGALKISISPEDCCVFHAFRVQKSILMPWYCMLKACWELYHVIGFSYSIPFWCTMKAERAADLLPGRLLLLHP